MSVSSRSKDVGSFLLLRPDWRFADALSYIKYAVVGVYLNESTNLLFACLPSELTTSVVVSVSKCVIAPLNKKLVLFLFVLYCRFGGRVGRGLSLISCCLMSLCCCS